MKKSLIAPVLSIVGIVLIAGLFLYFHLSLRRLDKNMAEVQNTLVADAGTISAIVNFFNTNINAQTNQN